MGIRKGGMKNLGRTLPLIAIKPLNSLENRIPDFQTNFTDSILKIGHQESSPSNCHQGDVPHKKLKTKPTK